MADPGIPRSVERTPQLTPDDIEEDEVDVESRRPGRAVDLLIAAYWVAWLTTVISDTLISVRIQFWPGEVVINSPIVRYIYTRYIYQWPFGGYYILAPFFAAWDPVIGTVFFVSSSVCTTLHLSLTGHLRPFKNDGSDALVTLWMAFCLLGASWVGLTRHEISVVVVSFGWLSARTVQLVCFRKEMYLLKASEKSALVAFVASLVLFSVVYVMALGLTLDVVAIVLLVEATLTAWRVLPKRPGDQQEMEKGGQYAVIE